MENDKMILALVRNAGTKELGEAVPVSPVCKWCAAPIHLQAIDAALHAVVL
ncbi:MAG: hypothetical protein K2G02_04325 [Phocaeicola sp.]|uniref:hypothetical protein n=1 Tax=Phocaeicola sp. TaxID=2773926 RepID=UPI0023C1B048|nr:hypothetical protein [Phocaeicola sp.]MDE5676545.1 hypothetical protein [Phocaeicola sp.]MDE6180340.1 hypothetical protein [Phocaeicola sp.]